MMIGFWLPEDTLFGISREWYAFLGVMTIIPILSVSIIYLVLYPKETMTKGKKIAITIPLLVLGGVFLAQGIPKIIFAEGTQSIDVSNLGVSAEPTPQITQRGYTYNVMVTFPNGTQRPASVSHLSIIFKTMDTYAVGNPVQISAKAEVRNPDNIDALAVVLTEPNYDYSWVDASNVGEFVDETASSGNFIELFRNSTTTFGVEGEAIFPSEREVAIFLIVKAKDSLEKYERFKDAVLTIYPASEKLQTEVNRLTVAQIKQSIEDTTAQQRSNNIIEGLTWIFLAWIPLELTTRLWF
jgi:hypothetical protein